MDNKSSLIPLNRHVVIEPHAKENETNSGVLVPEDFKPDLDKFVTASVVHVSQDCKEALKEACFFHQNRKVDIVVDRSMIEEVTFNGVSHHIILENYIVGVIGESINQSDLSV